MSFGPGHAGHRAGSSKQLRYRPLASTGLALAALLSGCAYLTGPGSRPQPERPCCDGAEGDLAAVYLGTGGWILEWDGEMILGAPLFTNPGFITVGLGQIRSDTARVDELLPPVDGARAILVGHAHYDHLLDVPWIARARAPDAWVIGNRTTANILAGDQGIARDRVHAVNHLAGQWDAAGSWLTLPGGRIRIKPLRTRHSPHFQGIELFKGTVDRPMTQIPTAAREWVGGQGLSFLIEFLDRAREQVRYRVYYSDISASAPWGYPSPDEVPLDVDLAIICAPSSHEAEWFPEGVTSELKPRYALLGHWEDFFEPWSQTPKFVPFTDIETFISRLERALPEDSLWGLPNPGDTLWVAARTR